MGRNIVLTDQGTLELKELVSNGSAGITIQPPADLTGGSGAYTLTLPVGDGAAGEFLSTNGSGVLSWGSGTASLQSAYDIAGKITTAGAVPVEIEVGAASGNVALLLDQDDDFAALQITKDGTGAGAGINILNAGTDPGITLQSTSTGTGVFLDVDGNSAALSIDSEASGSPLVLLAGLNTNSRGDVAFGTARTGDPSAPSEGDIWYNSTTETLKYRASASSVSLTANQSNTLDEAYDQGGAGAGRTITADTGAVQITGSAQALLDLDQGGNFGGLTVDKTANGAGDLIALTNAGTGRSLYIDHNYAGITENYAFLIESAQTGAANRAAARIDCTGDNTCLELNSTGSTANNVMIDIDQTNGGAICIDVDTDTTSNALSISHTGSNLGPAIIANSGTGGAVPSILQLVNNNTSALTNAVLHVDQNAATSTAGILIENSGTAKYIDTDAGAGTPAHLTNGGVWTDASCFKRFKRDIEPVNEKEVLQKIRKMELSRYYDKSDRSETPRRRFGPFQDDLVGLFGLDPGGVSAVEVAAIALAGVKALAEEIKA